MHINLQETTSTIEHGIAVRPRIFDWQFENIPVDWAGNRGLTQFLNVFSVLAPHTEGFAIRLARTVTRELERGGMKQEVGGFCGQEARHAQAHKRFNSQVIDAQGFECSRLDAAMIALVERIESWPIQYQVASLCSGEHFIALVAQWYLNEAPREQIHPDVDRLFAWHCMEEIEHCAVAFDLYDQLFGTGLQANLVKKRALLRVTRLLSPMLYTLWQDMMAQAHAMHGSVDTASKGLDATAVRKLLGALMRQSGHYFDYYRPRFHPWAQHEQYLPRLPELLQQVAAGR